MRSRKNVFRAAWRSVKSANATESIIASTGRPAYACDYCGSMISPMAGTIFEKSTTSLRLWLYAMYLMASTRCGISAKQIQRETGVTYKTAWRMFRQIRALLSETDMQLEGSAVEMDESYFGAKRKRGGKKGRPSPSDSSKQCVVGVVERGVGTGRVVCYRRDRCHESYSARNRQRAHPA